MKQYNGFKSEASGSAMPQLPAGAYVAGIKNVKIEGTEPDQQLILRLDIIEGEWAGYYTKRYNRDSQGGGRYEPKYKGDFRVQIPNDDNTRREHPEWDVRAFNNLVFCVENSNPGYKWDWDEKKLKGKTIGINVRDAVYNGNAYTQIGRLEVADDVRKGLVKPMKPKSDGSALPQTAPEAADPRGFTPVETEELPF